MRHDEKKIEEKPQNEPGEELQKKTFLHPGRENNQSGDYYDELEDAGFIPDMEEESETEAEDRYFDDLEEDDDGERGGQYDDDFSPADSDPRQNSKLRKIYAESEVTQIDFIFSSAFSFLNKVDRAKCKMTAEERAALMAATEARIQAHGYPVTPLQMYFIALAGVGGSMYVRSNEVKKREEQQQKAKQAFKIVEEQHSGEHPPEVVEEAKKAIKEEKEEKVWRNDFRVDSEGYYTRTDRGQYVKGEKTEKAPPEVLTLIEAGKKEGLSDGQINEQIRLALYGSKKPKKNT